MEPLNTEASRELVESVSTDGALPPAVITHIVEHTGGVPLQIEMMTKSLIESNLLFLDATSRAYELEGSLESLSLPQTLRDSIRLRLARVAESDANLARL